ncbi:hypothetical protein QR680_005401 [Steinernema hermaphroditum]|uniref:MAGUK p55 subfamily member 5 n=1 Tax=Steinernema hermaphroditum TaxID=289476 RepID=A0AA39HRV7_9BILA|nr:hypothetical protein QR680_005401 [Steinernema hermaphroditum]
MAAKGPQSSASALEHFLMTKFRTVMPPSSSNEMPFESNTLTFRTFRPYDSSASSYRSSPMSPSPPSYLSPLGGLYQNIPVTQISRPGYYITSARESANLYDPVEDFASENDTLFEEQTHFASIHHLNRRVYTYSEEDIVVELQNPNERVGFAMSGGADEDIASSVNSVVPGGFFTGEGSEWESKGLRGHLGDSRTTTINCPLLCTSEGLQNKAFRARRSSDVPSPGVVLLDAPKIEEFARGICIYIVLELAPRRISEIVGATGCRHFASSSPAERESGSIFGIRRPKSTRSLERFAYSPLRENVSRAMPQVQLPLKRPESIPLGSFRRRRRQLTNCPSTASTSSTTFGIRSPLPGFVILVARNENDRVALYGTPADRAGLCVGDEIIEVNGHSVEGREHTEIVDLIHRRLLRGSRRRPGLGAPLGDGVSRESVGRRHLTPLCASAPVDDPGAKPLRFPVLRICKSDDSGTGLRGTNPQLAVRRASPGLCEPVHFGSEMSMDIARYSTASTKRSEISLALEVVVPTEELRCGLHGPADCATASASTSSLAECSCDLVENELLVFNEFQGAKCIKSRIIQLRVRRKHDQNNEEEVRAEAAPPRVSDAYFVSVDKDHIKEVGKRLKRNYPGLKTYDMETVAALPSGRLPEPLSARSSNAGQMPLNQTNLQVHDEFHGVACSPNGEEIEDSGHGSSGSPTLDDQKERLRKYEEDLRKRRENDEKRAKENAFLRSSVRSSKKLQQLEASNGATKIVKPIVLGEADAANYVDQEPPETIEGYTNECYVTGEYSFREDAKPLHAEEQLGEAIPLEQVMVSANRVAEHLEQAEGRLEDSRIIRDYFSREPVQQAIQATAVHRSREMMTQQPTTSSSSELSFDQVSSEAHGNLKVVKFYKSEDSYLGATVRNDGERVIIGRVVKGGIAEKSRLLKEGDELIEVNGNDLRGRSVADVCDLLRTLSGEVTFVFVPSEEPEEATAERTSPGQKTPAPVVQHMRALFDYDPEDDFYMPCKELGLSFRRGDILHVISMADENWWQAYRDGDENHQSLAGLVPSASFQQQVIQYNREIDRDSGHLIGKEGDIFGCAKKKSTVKGKKGNGKKVANELKSKDEIVDSDQEILTYEDVSLYLSRTGRKRPIVLCGPEGVGSLELRQRLIESDKERFASAVPHTTRPKKEDAKMGSFVEFGEFQKALYGTSVAAIKTVVEQSKSCLLSLKPESLKALRMTGLMPYVIFVAPPSLQQLRRQKEMLGQHSVKDDDLKAVLNQGKQIEMEYGHLFDTIIVNVDLDRTLKELTQVVHRIDTEPQWVPSFWVAGNNSLNGRAPK